MGRNDRGSVDISTYLACMDIRGFAKEAPGALLMLAAGRLAA